MKLAPIFLTLLAFAFSSAAFAQDAKKSAGNEKQTKADSVYGDEGCGSVVGRTLAHVCSRYQTGAGTAGCFEAGADAYLSECALGACDRYTSETATTGCIRAIRNRYYTNEEIAICDRIDSEHESTRCFASAGRLGDMSADLRHIRRRIIDALDYLRSERYQRVEYELEALLEDLP